MKELLHKLVIFLVILSMVLNSLYLQAAPVHAATTIQVSAEIQAAQTQRESSKQVLWQQTGTTPPPPVVAPKPVNTQILPTGGVIRSEKGEFSITFSKSFGKAFSATLKTIPTGNTSITGMHSVGVVYSLETKLADGTVINTFAPQPAPTQDSDANAANNFIIRFKYTDTDITDLNEMTLGVYVRETSTGKWRRLPSLVDANKNMVVAQADKPGNFAVFAKRTVKAEATAANLKLVLDPDDNVGWAVWNGTKYEELHFNVMLARSVRDKFTIDACNVDILLTREAANPDSLDRPTRAREATDFNADMFVTLAFNALHGSPWGWVGDGGIEAWARSGHPDDDALVNQFYDRIKEYTDRPHNKATEHPSRYPAFNALPANMTYAHIETLFLDHNYDWPIIHTNFDAIANAAYAATRTQLEAKGMICKSGNKLPSPPSAEELKRLRNLGDQNYHTYGADPVSFSTGNHIVHRDLFSLPEQDHSSFNFRLTYNSQDERDGYAGIGWSAPIPYVQLYNDDSATVTLEGGTTYYFTPNGNGYNSPPDLHATLERTDGGWKWTNVDGSSMTFKEALLGFGPITESRNRHGDTYKYEYDFDGQPAENARPSLLKITDTAGRVITFDSDDDGHITGIHLPGNHTYQFEYTNSDLTKITDPKGNSYHYEYDNKDRLIKQWDPENYLFLQNTYDGLNRVVKQVDTNGAVLTIDYASSTTTYTDNLGKVTQYFYDDQTRVTSIKDALGFTTTTTYDSQNNVQTRTDQRGNQFTFTYDGQGNPLTATGPEGYSASYTYNSFGDLTSMTDNGGPNGQPRKTTFTVNGKGDITAIKYADGTSIQMTYDGHGNLKTSKDENGNLTSYDYDGDGNLLEITDPLNRKTSFTYDELGRKTSMKDANNNVVKFSYDANGNIITIVDPKNQITSFTYDKNDNLIKMVDRRGGISSYTYDENLKLKSETDPEGNTTRYAYDAMYNLISVTDPNGNVTRYGYNDRYEVTQIRSARNGLTRFEYDPNGNLTKITDALNQVTRFEYNGLNLPTAEINPLNGRTSNGYDSVGHLLEQTNPRGAKTIFTYDLRDRVIQIEDALHGISKIAYDPAGNPVTYTDANIHSVSLHYDDANQLIEYDDAAGQPTHFDLDGVGNLLKVTDALGHATSYNYDANDNVVSVVNALSQTSTFAYDEEDNLKATKDGLGNLTRFAYDLNGRLTQLTEAGGQISKFAYDGNGNLAAFTNAKGNTWSFAYDALDLRISETDPLGQTTKYGYDLLGRLINTTDAKGIITGYGYNPLNNLTSVTQNVSSRTPNFETNVTTSYGYDEVGNLISILDARGNKTSYIYDLLNRPTKEQNALGNAWQYAYDPVGNLTQRIDGNGDQTGYQYTITDLLEKVSYPDHSSTQYTYDAVGNQLSATTSTLGTIVNKYDELNRLVSSRDSAWRQIKYTYDEAGNTTSITYPDGKKLGYAYDSTNYLSQVTDPQGLVTKIARDQTHNTTLIENPNKTLAKYEFDKAEQLKSVTNLRKNGDLINSFAYKLDAVGNRIETTATYPFRDGNHTTGETGKKVQQLITKYQYDPLYRLTSSSDTLGRRSLYSYDAVGNRTQLITNVDPGGKRDFDFVHKRPNLTFNYTYDEINALTKITQGNETRDLSQVTAALKAFIDQVSAQSGKQIVTATADALIQAATAIVTQIQSGSPDQKTLESAIDGLSQQVQNARKQKQIKSESVTKALLETLKEASDANDQSYPKGTQEIQFTYDRNGNRTEQWIARWNNTDVQDQNGQHGIHIKYKYDFENRLTNVSGYLGRQNNAETDQGRPQVNTSMTYDAYGRLFERRTAPGNAGQNPGTDASPEHGDGYKSVQFAYDGLDPIAEYTYSGWQSHNPNARNDKHTNFYRGDGRILSLLTNAEAGYAPGRTRYFHYDGLNSVTALTGHIGQDLHGYQYEDFGALRDNNRQSDDSSNYTDPHNHYTYTGQEWDETTDLYHFYARDYDPETGTWLQQDPYRGQTNDPMSLHRYGYVGNNPIRWIDFLGYDLDDMLIGQKVHDYIQSEYLHEHPGAIVETGVCNGYEEVVPGINCKKRPDIRNPYTHEVYEIKPDNEINRVLGPVQLNGYIDTLNELSKANGDSRCWKSGSWSPPTKEFWLPYSQGTVKITIRSTQNGMIYYSKEKFPLRFQPNFNFKYNLKANQNLSPKPATQNQPAIDTGKVATGVGITAGLAVGGYIVYRVLRTLALCNQYSITFTLGSSCAANFVSP